MKKTLVIFGLIALVSCCAAYPIDYINPTDYINGKWYSCDAWTVNDSGDTLFTSTRYGYKVYYSYNKKHQRTGYRDSFGIVCKISYTYSATIEGEHCSSGRGYRNTYNGKGQLFRREEWGIHTRFEYDSLGNEIYSITTRDNLYLGTVAGVIERWNEYNNDNILVKTVYSTGEIDEFYDDGTIKYKLRIFGGNLGDVLGTHHKTWFDSHGYVVRDSSKIGDHSYTNKYDQYGRIIYEGMEKLTYQYFTQDDTIYKCIVNN